MSHSDEIVEAFEAAAAMIRKKRDSRSAWDTFDSNSTEESRALASGVADAVSSALTEVADALEEAVARPVPIFSIENSIVVVGPTKRGKRVKDDQTVDYSKIIRKGKRK